MIIINFLSLTAVSIFIVISIRNLFSKNEIKVANNLVISLLLLSVTILAVNTTILNYDSDIGRQLFLIDNYKTKGLAGLKASFLNDSLWLKQVYFYLVSLLPKSQYIMAINAVLVYGIVLHLLRLKLKCRSYLLKSVSKAFLCFILFNTFVIITGSIRYPLACALSWLGLYYYENKTKKRFVVYFVFILCLFSSILLHHGIVMLIGIYFLTKIIKRRSLIFAFSFLILFFASYLGDYLSNSSNLYISHVGTSIISELRGYHFGSNSVLIADAIIPLFVILLYFNTKAKKTGILTRLSLFCFSLSIAFSFIAPQISQRLLYAAAMNTLDLFDTIDRDFKNYNVYVICSMGLFLGFFILSIFDLKTIVQIYSFF